MAQEGRKEKPILPTTPSHSTDRKTSRTNLTDLKSAEDFFFFLSSFPPEFLLLFCPSFFSLFLLPSILYLFYSFFLPSFIYSVVLIFVKIPSYLASDLSLFLLPSFLSFSIPFFPPSLLFFFSFLFFFFAPIPLFPTGETTKPGVLKRPELDRVTPINISSRPVSTGD